MSKLWQRIKKSSTTVLGWLAWVPTVALAITEAQGPDGKINWIKVIAILGGGGVVSTGLIRSAENRDLQQVRAEVRSIAAEPVTTNPATPKGG